MGVEGNKLPYGTTLLSRNKPENLKLWGPEGVGYIDIDPTALCTVECPYYQHRQDATHSEAVKTPIHLLIASFRDRLCPRTLHNAFRRAENPKRIFIRIIDQTDPSSDLDDDAGCFDRYCQDFNPNCHEYKDQVRTIHVDSRKAKGPTDARSKLSAMVEWDFLHRDDADQLDFVPVQLQDFCMQTDSHMDFSDRYDTDLIFMFHRAANDYAVLSTYVADISQNNQDVRVVPNLCMVQFTSTIRNWGTKECRNLLNPKLTNAMWGAGLSFHRCHAEINVPVDPYLDQVFDGEEGSRGIRFFTHGYDVYTPDRVLVTHDYKTHQSNPVVHSWGKKRLRGDADIRDTWKFTEDIENHRPDLTTLGVKRVNMLLGIGAPDSEWDVTELDRIRKGRYGLGTRRTLEQAVDFTGINLRERKMAHNKCGNLEWVPFEEVSDFGVTDVLQRGRSGGRVPLPPKAKDTRSFTNRDDERESSSLMLPGAIVGSFLLFAVWKLARRPKRKGDKHRN